MNLLGLFYKKSTFDQIKSAFSFMVDNYGFALTQVMHSRDFTGEHLLVYRNEASELQVEVCGDEHWFHCEIRRLLNGIPAKYSDKQNTAGFESLAILESNNNYDHFDYYAGGVGLKIVLKKTAALFKRHKAFFTTNSWIDIDRIEMLRDEEFKVKFGVIPDRTRPAFFDELKVRAATLLLDNGFIVLVDSEELPPFHRDRAFKHVSFQKSDMILKLGQRDWRELYNLYYIDKNGHRIFEIDIAKLSTETALERAMSKLKWAIPKL